MFSQALAGEPELVESLPKPMGAGSFGFAATLTGELEGRFCLLLDGSMLDAPLMGDGADQKAGWSELLRETVDAAAGELLARRARSARWRSSKRSRQKSRSRAPFSSARAIGPGRFWCATGRIAPKQTGAKPIRRLDLRIPAHGSNRRPVTAAGFRAVGI